MTFSRFCAYAVFALAAGNAHAATLQEIGTTVAVKNQVTIEIEAAKRRLDKGEKVHENEIIVTAKSASAEIKLNDETKLAVGPGARIVLDKFVYDAGGTPGKVSIGLTKGAFRFITGKNDSAAYEIVTPTASIGVRGTIFDVYVAQDGEVAVLLHEGAVDVCPGRTNCRRHDTVARFVHVNLQGILSSPLRWDGGLMNGITAAAAFPFVGRQLAIDPVRRLRHADLTSGVVGKAARTITKPIGDVGKTTNRALRSLPRLPF